MAVAICLSNEAGGHMGRARSPARGGECCDGSSGRSRSPVPAAGAWLTPRCVRGQPGWLPDGLRYVASWVTEDFRRCFQVMECEDRALLTQWTARWDDLIEFEVIPVITLSVPVVAGFVLLGAAVLVGRSLLDGGRKLLEARLGAQEPRKAA